MAHVLLQLSATGELVVDGTSGLLPKAALRGLRALAGLPDPVTEDDLDRTDTGEDPGFKLAEALRQAAAPWDQLRDRLADSSVRALVVDIADPDLRALPWERLYFDEHAPLEVERRAVVARLHPAEECGARPDGHFEILRWCPTPHDQGCGRINHRMDELAHSLGIPIDAFENVVPKVPFVFHVVSGGHGLEHLEPHLARGREGRLGLVLSRCELVILAVQAGNPDELRGLAQRFLELGAASVVVPAGAAEVEGLQRFGDGFYQSLARGSGLGEAVLEGRRKVRDAGRRHQGARWSDLHWLVGSALAAEAPPLREALWRPEGWPRPAADAALLLDAARELAWAQGGGFLGIEHVVASLRTVEGGGQATRQIRASLPRLDQFESALAALSPQTEAQELAITPRLSGWREGLTDGFSLDALCAVLAMDLTAGLSGSHQASGAPADTLTVLGGPEDGRVLVLSPGEGLGRHSEAGGASHPLYQGTRLTDRRLSREHLVWKGQGLVELTRAARRFRAGEIARVGPGEVDIRAGDLLVLTHATRLICG
jgi:hypothetical protein